MKVLTLFGVVVSWGLFAANLKVKGRLKWQMHFLLSVTICTGQKITDFAAREVKQELFRNNAMAEDI